MRSKRKKRIFEFSKLLLSFFFVLALNCQAPSFQNQFKYRTEFFFLKIDSELLKNEFGIPFSAVENYNILDLEISPEIPISKRNETEYRNALEVIAVFSETRTVSMRFLSTNQEEQIISVEGIQNTFTSSWNLYNSQNANVSWKNLKRGVAWFKGETWKLVYESK